MCERGAIEEVGAEIGTLQSGCGKGVRFVSGRLKVGVPTATPLVRQVKKRAGNQGVVILDAPPGTSCPVVETVVGADMAVLVAEPTPFGLNDLVLAVEMLRVVGVEHGVVINRAGIGDSGVEEYCREEARSLVDWHVEQLAEETA